MDQRGLETDRTLGAAPVAAGALGQAAGRAAIAQVLAAGQGEAAAAVGISVYKEMLNP